MRRCHDMHCILGGGFKPGIESASIKINHLFAADILDEYANSSPACLKAALPLSIVIVFQKHVYFFEPFQNRDRITIGSSGERFLKL